MLLVTGIGTTLTAIKTIRTKAVFILATVLRMRLPLSCDLVDNIATGYHHDIGDVYG